MVLDSQQSVQRIPTPRKSGKPEGYMMHINVFVSSRIFDEIKHKTHCIHFYYEQVLC